MCPNGRRAGHQGHQVSPGLVRSVHLPDTVTVFLHHHHPGFCDHISCGFKSPRRPSFLRTRLLSPDGDLPACETDSHPLSRGWRRPLAPQRGSSEKGTQLCPIPQPTLCPLLSPLSQGVFLLLLPGATSPRSFTRSSRGLKYRAVNSAVRLAG